MSDNAVSVAPDFYKVLMENDQVRVRGLDAEPGDKTSMHSHPAVVAHIVRGGSLTVTFPDGTSMPIEAEDGQATYMDAVTRGTEITGTSGVSGILVELKD